jgi:N-hydroxyarylamine O-acetyltransferase
MPALLDAKGYSVVGSFSCRGWDTWLPLRLVDGINRAGPTRLTWTRRGRSLGVCGSSSVTGEAQPPNRPLTGRPADAFISYRVDATIASMTEPRRPLDRELRAAYLRRLGLDVEPPSAEALHRLVQRQVERVPYETMWIAAGETWGIGPHDAVARIALDGRGGYCYHLNGALAELLWSLGYAGRRHVGGVHGPEGPNADCVGNHLVLTVSGLPTSANPSGVWYVDAGLGDALHHPLPLAPGVYQQEPFQLALEEMGGGASGWHLRHDPTGGFTGMSWTMGDAELDAFAAQHEWLSTSPESGFVRVVMAERRDSTGVDVIRGLVLTRIGTGAVTHAPLTKRDDWFAVLADVFDLRFERSTPEALDRLWERVLAGHREWEGTGGT